jgi:hypothetical protein
VFAGDEPLELVRGALGDQPPVVEDRDPVGEFVRFLQVLRREEDRDATSDEAADDLPHGASAARVEAGGRLVEEDDARVTDQAHREVEPTPHAAGVGAGRLVGCLDQIESLEQVACAPAAFEAAQVVQVGHQDQVLLTGEQLSTAENWPVTPIAARTASGSRAGSWPETRISPPSAPIRPPRSFQHIREALLRSLEGGAPRRHSCMQHVESPLRSSADLDRRVHERRVQRPDIGSASSDARGHVASDMS